MNFYKLQVTSWFRDGTPDKLTAHPHLYSFRLVRDLGENPIRRKDLDAIVDRLSGKVYETDGTFYLRVR